MIINDRDCFFRVYITLRSNEFLRCYGNTSLFSAIPLVGGDILFLL